jgi:cytosine/adenosine deaminase-related metal-dependent hydrolase
VSSSGANLVGTVTNVTAFVGSAFEPSVVDLEIDSAGTVRSVRAATDSTPARDRDGEKIDGAGLLAFPGMVDCHDHLRVLTPGLSIAEGLKLDEFLRVMWTTQAKMGTTEYRLGALLGSVQRLKTGVTTVADHCYTFHVPGLDEASIDGYEASGIRWAYARGIMTRPFEPVCETWDVAEHRIRQLVECGRVKPSQLFVAPVSVRQASPDDFRRSVALAEELGCAVYTHASETAAEQDVWRTEYGTSPVRALDSLGFLSARAVLVHCVVLDDGEIELLAERGVSVVHCPTNHMKLAKGFTRVPDLLSAGVNVALGIDMMADMLIEMRMEIGMHAAHRLDPNAVRPLDAFRMATVNGARALGIGEHVGLIAEGMAADIVLFEGRSPLQAPMLDPAYSLLYSTHPGLVRHVLVGGRIVVRDGRSTLVNEDDLLREAEDVASAYLRRIGVEQAPWNRGGTP